VSSHTLQLQVINFLIIYCIANEIINRTVGRLGVPPDVLGFDNENDLVEELTAAVANGSTSCFSPGAGNLIIWLVC
jgi:hypothetical protein